MKMKSLLQPSSQTSWFHLLLVVFMTVGAVYIIGQALYAPMVQWQSFNEVHAAALKEALEETN